MTWPTKKRETPSAVATATEPSHDARRAAMKAVFPLLLSALALVLPPAVVLAPPVSVLTRAKTEASGVVVDSTTALGAGAVDGALVGRSGGGGGGGMR